MSSKYATREAIGEAIEEAGGLEIAIQLGILRVEDMPDYPTSVAARELRQSWAAFYDKAEEFLELLPNRWAECTDPEACSVPQHKHKDLA